MTMSADHCPPTLPTRVLPLSLGLVFLARCLGGSLLTPIQKPVHFRQELTPKLAARRHIKPVEKMPASGRLAKRLVGSLACLGEVLRNFLDGGEVVTLPAAIPDCTRRFDACISKDLQAGD